MKQNDVEKIENIFSDLFYAHQSLTSKGSKAYKGYRNLLKEAMKDGHLEKKYKELIAVGISLAVNCETCQAYHINQALKSGATEEQVVEVIEVALEMGGGPIVVRSSFAFKVLEYLKERKDSNLLQKVKGPLLLNI